MAAANTLFMGVFSFGLVLGPLVAGVVIGTLGFSAAYAVDVGTFVIALGTVIVGLPSLPAAEGSRRAGIGSVVEGLRFLRGRTNLLMTFVVDINAMVFGMPRALFPVLAITHFHGGAATAGVLYSAPAIGGLLVAASGGWTSHVRRQGRAVVIAIAVWGASIALFGLVHALTLGIVLLAIAGGADAVSAIFRSTILQVAAPARDARPALRHLHRRGGRRTAAGRPGIRERRDCLHANHLGGERWARLPGRARAAGRVWCRRSSGTTPRSHAVARPSEPRSKLSERGVARGNVRF